MPPLRRSLRSILKIGLGFTALYTIVVWLSGAEDNVRHPWNAKWFSEDALIEQADEDASTFGEVLQACCSVCGICGR